ncbi:hypothetical protein C8R47DRAFT_1065314 [Mycena vitilis]|nr:hypothetical protein C8R47DRAFT_1065314 [Mycena vitilis]
MSRANTPRWLYPFAEPRTCTGRARVATESSGKVPCVRVTKVATLVLYRVEGALYQHDQRIETAAPKLRAKRDDNARQRSGAWAVVPGTAAITRSLHHVGFGARVSGDDAVHSAKQLLFLIRITKGHILLQIVALRERKRQGDPTFRIGADKDAARLPNLSRGGVNSKTSKECSQRNSRRPIIFFLVLGLILSYTSSSKLSYAADRVSLATDAKDEDARTASGHASEPGN